jgi:hypothetical protein
MRQNLETMQIAVRVLSALMEKRDPDPADVQKLRECAPSLAHEPLDELACDVMRNALKERADARSDGL